MPIESKKKKLELINQIVTEWTKRDGKQLDGLTIDELKKLLKKEQDITQKLNGNTE